ncbi:MAG: DUF3592 domain-containing protein [Erysipelotrichaceae bacterium]|nr:DUF3592 domain-containing protein [Erysipelotrichaceae bacterium]
MYRLFEILIRYGLLIAAGVALIVIAVHRAQTRAAEFADPKYVRTKAWVRSIDTDLRINHDKTRYIYRVEAEYLSGDEKIIALSQNTIHSEEDYEYGQKIEILYNSENPSCFYIADDRNFATANRIEIAFGAFFALTGIVLLVIDLLKK